MGPIGAMGTDRGENVSEQGEEEEYDEEERELVEVLEHDDPYFDDVDNTDMSGEGDPDDWLDEDLWNTPDDYGDEEDD